MSNQPAKKDLTSVSEFKNAKAVEAPPQQQVTVVAVPVELFGDLVEVLQDMPYRTVGKLLNRLGQLKAQSVPFVPEQQGQQ
jgi:hypothetical protein